MKRTEAEEFTVTVLTAYSESHRVEWAGGGRGVAESVDVPSVVSRAFDIDSGGDHTLRPWVGQLQFAMLARQHQREVSPSGSTDLPCPSWCDRVAGHTFDTFANGLRRNHVHRFADHASSVALELRERTTTPLGGISDIGTDAAALSIVVHVSDGIGYLTANGARRLAAQLMDAAEMFDVERRLLVGEGAGS